MVRRILVLLVISILMLSPVLLSGIMNFNAIGWGQLLRQVFVSCCIFIVPIVCFYRDVRIYLWLLSPVSVATIFFCFSIYYFAVNPGIELVGLILQTNPREASEAITPFLISFAITVFITISIYIFLVRSLPPLIIRPGRAMIMSTLALAGALGVIYTEKQLYYKSITSLTIRDLFDSYHYPLNLASGIYQARAILQKNNLEKAERFKFDATKRSPVQQREAYLLIIGESSRYDRWQINGYNRETSPRLARRSDVVTFSNVISGAHYTWVSVPQIITRATPLDYNLQYREKSVMSAFKEAGFNTYWLSNQSADEILWTGSIVLHARTADVSVFSPSYSPNFEFENYHDERLLPLLDSIVTNDPGNLFIVLHTMGNHWDYSKRYPPQFDFFQPSGHTENIDARDARAKYAILNSYDNSVRYADFVIDSAISIVERHCNLAAAMFISDHGEDLYDTQPDHIDFHFRPSKATLHVPLFIWTSKAYRSDFPEKCTALYHHRNEKIGTENIFYTLTDLGDLSFPSYDSTKSIASEYFLPSGQHFYTDHNRAAQYSDLVQTKYVVQ